MAQKLLNGVHISGATRLDFMPTHESEGIITLGRYDSNTTRYHNIKSYVSSTLASNYLKFSLHNGTESTVVDVLTLKGDGSATFAGDITSAGLTVDYTGNRTGDAGILVTNDNDDWGVKVDKDGTADYGILSQTDGENAIVVRNAAGVNKIQLQGDGDATFAGTVTANGTVLTGDTDFVSAANGGTFGGNIIIKHASSPTLTLTDDSPDPDNVGTIKVANTYMDFGLDSAEGVASSRMRFLIDGESAVEFLGNTTYFRQTNLHVQNTSLPQLNFRKDAAIVGGSDIGKINFAATNDDGASYTVGGNIQFEGDGTWDLSDAAVSNAPTRMKMQLRNSSGALQNAILLSSNLNANFYGNGTFAGHANAATGFRMASGQAIDFIDSNIGYNSIERNTTLGGLQINTGNTASLNILDNNNAIFAGSVNVKNGLIDAASVTSATATTDVESVVHATYTAAFFDFVIKNGTNVRAGVVYACHDGTTVSFTETSTVDLGDTSDVTLSVVIVGSNMILRATSTSSTWTIKSLIRAI
tara:strand:- start:1301 stop:2884 length:1584 start_codon:yes stop_codon:yes gene_type:complete